MDASRASYEVLQRLHAAVNAHDAEKIGALCHEDVLWEDPAAGSALRGRKAVQGFHSDMMFRSLPDVHIELLDGPYFSEDGLGVAVHLRITGTMTGPLDPPGFAPTGASIDFETAEFSRIRDGMLVHHRVVLDMLGLGRQIGAVPKARSRAERLNVWFQHLVAWRSRRHET
jgi:predicted ester cyclase